MLPTTAPRCSGPGPAPSTCGRRGGRQGATAPRSAAGGRRRRGQVGGGRGGVTRAACRRLQLRAQLQRCAAWAGPNTAWRVHLLGGDGERRGAGGAEDQLILLDAQPAGACRQGAAPARRRASAAAQPGGWCGAGCGAPASAAAAPATGRLTEADGRPHPDGHFDVAIHRRRGSDVDKGGGRGRARAHLGRAIHVEGAHQALAAGGGGGGAALAARLARGLRRGACGRRRVAGGAAAVGPGAPARRAAAVCIGPPASRAAVLRKHASGGHLCRWRAAAPHTRRLR